MRITALLALLLTFSWAALSSEPIGHWTLDEKEGDEAADSSPSKASAKVSGPSRVEGKIGGAFSFDGKDDYVEIPNTKELASAQNGSFTLAAWFKAESVPGGTEDANDANYAIVMKTGWHVGLYYTNEKKFTLSYFLNGNPDVVWHGIGDWENEYEPGAWHHVVGVVDKENRVTRIYVDGEHKQDSQEWDANATARDYGNETWKIGVGRPGADKWGWSAKGAIDDVRIYNVALSAEAIKALYESANK